jgi:hypothetical protein
MGTGKAHELPAGLARIRGRFERWRRTRKIGSRIPESLWASAVKVAGRYGISRTASMLRVDYYSLKKRVDQEAAVSGQGVMAPFLELTAPAAVGSCECVLELEDVCGTKMRVHLKGVEAPDLAALARCFRDAES